MNAAQKHAWFNLAVIAATFLTVLALIPVLHLGALGSFGSLGLLGLGPLFFRRRRGGVVLDERDRFIQGRSVLVAYSVFWLAFVASCMSLPVVYGSARGGAGGGGAVERLDRRDAGGGRDVPGHPGPVWPGRGDG